MGSGVLPLAMTTRSFKKKFERCSRLRASGRCDARVDEVASCAELYLCMLWPLGPLACRREHRSSACLSLHAMCEIKPMERLVLVSLTHCCASTSSLST